MSVQDTLAERGARYGDFTDHAEICQALMRVMQRAKGHNSWPDLSDVQRQSLTVIADKIARILSGDPDYADNWHDIQGYAKLVEDRLPKEPSAPRFDSASHGTADALKFGTAVHAWLAEHPEIYTMTNPTGEDTYAEFNARTSKPITLGAGYGLVEDCPECGYPTNAAGTHYATCSQFTAPEEYKAEAQVAFDEAAEISEALARQVSAGTLGENYCPQCGAAEGAFHNPDCTILRRGKSRLGKTLAELRAKQVEEEPAAAMDDDSPRMQAIGQNGNDGEHYDDPFAGAPKWARWKAQDHNGAWHWFICQPSVYGNGGRWYGPTSAPADRGDHNPNWRDTLITRT